MTGNVYASGLSSREFFVGIRGHMGHIVYGV